MFGKKPSPNFHGETDVAPVPEVPPISAQDLRTGFGPAPMPKNKLMLFIAIGIAVFVIAIGGVVYANYEGYLDISFLPSKKDKIISDMMDAMQTVKKAKYNIVIATKTEPWDGIHQPVENINDIDLPINQNAIGNVFKDMQLQLNVESYFDLEQAKTDIKAMNGYVKMGGVYGQGNNQMALGLELRKVGEDVYGMLSDYPALIATFVPQISELKDKWIKVSGDNEYGKYLDMAYESQDTIDEIYSTDNYGFAFDTGFIKLGRKLPSEILDGQSAMHYQVVMDMDNFEPMYTQMMAKTYKLQDVLSEDQFANLNLNSLDDLNKLELGESITPEMMKSMETLIDNMDIEIWVGEDDSIVRRMKATMYTVLPESQRTAEVGQTKFEILMDLSNVNQPMEITAPESAMTITEVVGMFTPKDTDGDGLYDADEADYGTDINNPDSDGDSYTDGSEVDGGYNPNGAGKLETNQVEFYDPNQVDDNDADEIISNISSRDAKRIADIRQIQTGLELFYNAGDSGSYGYPDCTAVTVDKMTTECSGSIEGIETYFSGINRMTDPSGNMTQCKLSSTSPCNYTYGVGSTTDDYSILFYLEGASLSGYAAGIHTANSRGIQ